MSDNFSVLIVEDDDDARNNMVDILSLDGYRTQSETHCLAAISAVEKYSFDAVIVDWRLPDQNADHLIPIIVRNQPNTPVVVVTGLRDFDTAVTALRSGAYDFLIKPINPDALRSVLSRIVERKRHLREIEDAQEKLVVNERLAAIGQMVTGLAHESRNAFQRSHACLAELALDLEKMPRSLLLVRKVQKALDDLNFLLEEVRDYSAPIILEERVCHIESLVRETWQNILDATKINSPPEFNLMVSADFPDETYVDCERVQQVIRNLLENAIFACGDPGRIEVCLKKIEPLSVRIEVADDGTGVASENLDSIFNPFFTTKTKGTGLGLALSKRIVGAHGGRIFVEPNETIGARFVVELPVRARRAKSHIVF